ncbi:MAG: ACT domain-containing protein [Desulfobacula sp.]|nr:ACT domain-containing protein [Desulfobacula sp.]
MFVEQISIFIENKEGRLAEVTGILRDANVNIRALSLADTTDFGVFRLIVNDNDKAEKALKKEGFKVGKTQVLAVEVMDEPGGLNEILDPFLENEINLEYMYAFANPKGKNAIMIFRFDDLDRALKILSEKNINAQKALEYGIVNKICEPDKLMEDVLKTANLIATKGKIALQSAKEVVETGLNADLETGNRIENDAFGLTMASDDAKEGTHAFLEKRKAVFKGERY